MLSYRHSLEHFQAMNSKKKAYIESAISRLNHYANEGRFDSDLASHIVQTYPLYADTILLIYSGLLHAQGFKYKSHDCLKTLCKYYDTRRLNNTAHYKARAFLTYALSFKMDLADNPSQEDLRLVTHNIGKAIALDNNYREAKLSLCMFLEDCERFNEAKENYQKLLKQHPDYPDAYHVYALFLRNMGEKELSMQIRKRFVDKFPNNINALWFYALDVFNILKDSNEAIKLLQKTLSLLGASSDPETITRKAKIYLALGIAHREMGEFELAGKAFRTAAQLDPSNAAVMSAQTHLKQDKSEKSHKHTGKMWEKIGKAFDVAKQLDPERFARNHLSGSFQTSSSVLLIESHSTALPVDYSELTAKLKFEKAFEELVNELASFDERVHECEEFTSLNSSLEFAENLAMGAQFAAANKELNQASQQYLIRLRWIDSSITGSLREFDPEKGLLTVHSPIAVPVTPTEKIITRAAPSIAPPIELKQGSLAVVKLPVKVKSPRDKCLDLLARISQIWQTRENELDKVFLDQLMVANKLFEDKNFGVAQTKLLAILQNLENQVKRIDEKKKPVTIESILVPAKKPQLKAQLQPSKNIEIKQQAHKKKNPATLFASRKELRKDNSLSFSTYVLYFSLPAAAICFILYAFYSQLSSPPEQTYRLKR